MKYLPFFATLALATQAWAADAQLVGLLAPESRMVVGLQLQQTQASPFGQFLLNQSGANIELDKLRSTIGFDPRTDLTDLVVGATVEGKGLAAGRGKFQPQLLTVMASMAGFPTENYRGVALIGGGAALATAKIGTQDPAVAFLNGSIVLMGDRGLLKSSIDRWLTASNTPSPLVAMVDEISSMSQAWAVVTSLAELQNTKGGAIPPQAAMLQNVLDKIDRIAGGLTFGDSVTVRGQAVTKSPQDAQALASVVQFLSSMSSAKEPLPFTPQVSASGATLNFTLSMTEQQLENLLKPQVKLRAAIQ